MTPLRDRAGTDHSPFAARGRLRRSHAVERRPVARTRPLRTFSRAIDCWTAGALVVLQERHRDPLTRWCSSAYRARVPGPRLRYAHVPQAGADARSRAGYAPGPHRIIASPLFFSQLCELANDPAQRPLRDSPTERAPLFGRCRRGRRAVGRLGGAVVSRPGHTVEQPSEGRQREHDEDCGKRAEPAKCRVVVIHARKSTSWPGRLDAVSTAWASARWKNAGSPGAAVTRYRPP